MGRTSGSRNTRGPNGYANGNNGGGGRKTLFANGRSGRHSGGRTSGAGTSNGVHSTRVNGHAGSSCSLSWAQQQDGLDTDNVTTTEEPVNFTNQVDFDYEVRLNGFSTILETLKNATSDVQQLVMDECDIILECRICRNLFRSLRNYLNHKLCFCTEKFQKISPGGLSQLMKLAADSFKINGGSKLNFPNPQTIPDISSPSPTKDTNTSKGINQPEDNHEEQQKPSFDMNNVIPMLTRATNQTGGKNGLRANERLTRNHDAVSAELRLLDNTTHYQGYARSRNVDFQSYVSKIHEGENAKRIMHDTVLLGPTGEIACAADPDVIQDIVDRLLKGVEDSQAEQEVKQQALTCPTCHTWFDTEKSLRMHMRTHAFERLPKKRKLVTVTSTTSDHAEPKPKLSSSSSGVSESEKDAEKPTKKPTKEKPTPLTSKFVSLSDSSTRTSRIESGTTVNIYPSKTSISTRQEPESSSIAHPPTVKVQTQPIVSKSKSSSPPLLFLNGSEKPTTGRRTNNSFSARLNTTPLSSLLPSLVTPDTLPSPTSSAPSTSITPKKRTSTNDFRKSVRSRARVSLGSSQSSEATSKKKKLKTYPGKVPCTQCSATFKDKYAMAAHRVFCTSPGATTSSLSTPTPTTSRTATKENPCAGIVRVDYSKPKSSPSTSPADEVPLLMPNLTLQSQEYKHRFERENQDSDYENVDADEDMFVESESSVDSISNEDLKDHTSDPEDQKVGDCDKAEPDKSNDEVKIEDDEQIEIYVTEPEPEVLPLLASISSTANNIGATFKDTDVVEIDELEEVEEDLDYGEVEECA